MVCGFGGIGLSGLESAHGGTSGEPLPGPLLEADVPITVDNLQAADLDLDEIDEVLDGPLRKRHGFCTIQGATDRREFLAESIKSRYRPDRRSAAQFEGPQHVSERLDRYPKRQRGECRCRHELCGG
jgi:hypothetical protein